MTKKKINLLFTENCNLKNKKKYKNILLGNWCKHINSKNKFLESIPYHWDDRDKLYRDYDDLISIYKIYLLEISSHLNKIHNKNFSIKYWEILIGPWLRSVLIVLWDRWEIINNAVKTFPEINKELPKNDNPIIFLDTEDYYHKIASNNWNKFIFQDIISFDKNNLRKLNINEDITFKNTKKSKPRFKINFLIRNFSYSLFNLLSKILNSNKYSKKKCIVILDKILDAKSLFKLILINRNIFTASNIYRQDNKFKISNKRSFKLIIKNDINSKYDHFIKYVNSRILWLLPCSLLEKYSENIKIIQKLNWPKEPGSIISSYSHMNNDIKKLYLSECNDKGSKIIIYQHGGTYGTTLFSNIEDHELNIADNFLTWGWENKKYNNIIKFQSLNFLQKKSLNKTHYKKDILLSLMALPKFSNNLYSIPIGYNQLDKYFNDQIQLIKLLKQNFPDRLKIRLHPSDKLYELNTPETWLKDLDYNFYDKNKSFSESLSSCKLIICTYNATTFLESISKNIPTIIFWDSNYWEINRNAKEYFEELFEVNIFHKDHLSLFNFLNKNYNQIEEWWFNKKTQKKIKSFCMNFAKTSLNPIRDFSKILNRINN